MFLLKNYLLRLCFHLVQVCAQLFTDAFYDGFFKIPVGHFQHVGPVPPAVFPDLTGDPGLGLGLGSPGSSASAASSDTGEGGQVGPPRHCWGWASPLNPIPGGDRLAAASPAGRARGTSVTTPAVASYCWASPDPARGEGGLRLPRLLPPWPGCRRRPSWQPGEGRGLRSPLVSTGRAGAQRLLCCLAGVKVQKFPVLPGYPSSTGCSARELTAMWVPTPLPPPATLCHLCVYVCSVEHIHSTSLELEALDFKF